MTLFRLLHSVMCIYLQCDVHSFVAGGVSTGSIMALKIDVLQVANAMDALEVAIRAEHARMTIDDMLKLSTNAAAGRTGMSCAMKYRRGDNLHGVQASPGVCCLRIS